MTRIDFLRVFFIELIKEVEHPIVTYKGVRAVLEEDTVAYVQHEFCSFNNYSNITDYQTRLEVINKNIQSELEKELYGNPFWMIEFDPDKIIENLVKLKSDLSYSFKGVDDEHISKYIENIVFDNAGSQSVYDPFEQNYLPTDLDCSKARQVFRKDLKNYYNLLCQQVEILIVKVTWLFFKFFPGKYGYSRTQSTGLSLEDREKMESLIKENKIEECLSFLLEFFKDNSMVNRSLIMLSMRFQQVKSDRLLNIKNLESIEINKNKIVHSILELLGE